MGNAQGKSKTEGNAQGKIKTEFAEPQMQARQPTPGIVRRRAAARNPGLRLPTRTRSLIVDLASREVMDLGSKIQLPGCSSVAHWYSHLMRSTYENTCNIFIYKDCFPVKHSSGRPFLSPLNPHRVGGASRQVTALASHGNTLRAMQSPVVLTLILGIELFVW